MSGTFYEVDGHFYTSKDDIPDLGGLVGHANPDGTRSYEGHYTDRNKLPKYDDLMTGSSAFLSDGGSFLLFKYYADTKTWEGGNKEVI